MTALANLLTPIYDLLQDEVVREKLEDSARVFFSNSNLTINLIPALIIGTLGLLFLLPLLGIPILDILGGMMSDVVGGHAYSAPSTGYGYVARGDTTYYDQTIADLQQQVNFKSCLKMKYLATRHVCENGNSRWRLSRRVKPTCAVLSTTTTPSKELKPPTMWGTAPRQEDNW